MTLSILFHLIIGIYYITKNIFEPKNIYGKLKNLIRIILNALKSVESSEIIVLKILFREQYLWS